MTNSSPEERSVLRPSGLLGNVQTRGTTRRQRQNALARRYHADPDSRQAVVTELIPLAHSLARRYKRGEEPLEDLVQVASLGLVMALDRFDPDRGLNFVAFAVPTITGELRRHFRDHGWAVHVPRSVQELAQRVTAMERAMYAEDGRQPTAAELAEVLATDEEAIVEARLAARGMRADSTDRPTDGTETSAPGFERFLRVTDDGYAAAEHRATLGSLTRNLDDRDRRILTMRYAQGRTQIEIGNALGISQMHVSRILRRIHRDLEQEAVTQSV